MVTRVHRRSPGETIYDFVGRKWDLKNHLKIICGSSPERNPTQSGQYHRKTVNPKGDRHQSNINHDTQPIRKYGRGTMAAMRKHNGIKENPGKLQGRKNLDNTK